MNYFILSYIIVIVMHNVSSQSNETCTTPFTDLKYKEIDENYCNKKTCIVKCCGENEMLYATGAVAVCKNISIIKAILFNRTNKTDVPDGLLDYTDLEIYKNDVYKSKEVSSKTFQEFTFLNNELFSRVDCAGEPDVQFYILEKGSLVYDNPNHYEYWTPMSTRKFCVEKIVGVMGGKSLGYYTIKYKLEDVTSLQLKTSFTAIGMLISACFLLLVLVVYCVLPQLRNIQGMLLTAYVTTLLCTYTLKASSILYSQETVFDCTVLTQILYYIILASFFWLKLMSFDIWWTFRGSRKRRAIHRRGVTVKFMIYALYAYGAPALITIFAVYMDKQDLPPYIAKPFFNSCLMSDTMLYYLYVPLMILTGCNLVLFLMTMYNIWLIKRNMASFDKSTVNKNKKNQNTFLLYMKLCSLMGVVWILEFVQIRIKDDNLPVSLYIILNSYNIFIGPIIFFMFVCKRNIFLMLCKRFNIENKWTRAMYKVNSSTVRSTQSKDSKRFSRSYSRTRSTDDAEEALNKGTLTTLQCCDENNIKRTENK